MRKNFSLVVVILSFLCAGFSNISAQTGETAEQSALLYEISGNDLKKPSYIFGTIHIICPNDMIASENFDKYIGATERIILELDFDDQAVMKSVGEAMYLPKGKTLADYYTAEQYAKVGELVKDTLGISIENVKNIHPLFLGTILTTSPKVLGCTPPGSYELSFVKTAAEQKKSIEGLETVEMELAAINSSPIEKQAESLYKIALDPQKSFAEFKKLIETYKLQNSDRIYEQMQKSFADDPSFQVNLLDDRNANWIPKIEKAVKEKPSFIAVGSGHLGGTAGVLNLLRKKGYKLKPIRL